MTSACGLQVRGVEVVRPVELGRLVHALGPELEASATLRRWLDGDAIPPHSVAVAVETQLRMLFGEPANMCALLAEVIERLAEAFPEEVQALDTT